MLIDCIAAHARFRGRQPAMVDLGSGRRWNYATLDADVNQTAHWLIAALGPASGTRVAVLSRNCAEMVILQLAAERAGAIFVPLNWRLAPSEIAALIADADPALVMLGAGFDVPGFSGPVHAIDALATLVATHASTPPPIGARRSADAPATLLYTSGTSGRPKGVMLSQANIFWSAANFVHGNAVLADAVFLCDMPLFHTAGLLANTRSPLVAGGTVLISQGFDAEQSFARLTDPTLGVTHYFSVPQMAQMLWNLPGFDPERLRHLALWATGGAPNPPVQVARYAGAGVPMSDGFGMSETGSNYGMPVGDLDLVIAKAGSCGLPYMGIAARIVDDDGCDLADGETGELWLAGPSISSGYWNQPETSAAAFRDGWFRTGDAAMRDADGFTWLVDRRKDMFISGGENVYPAEVEAAIAELEGVAEAAVIGVPDATWGEVGRAYVVAVSGRTLDPAGVIAHCSGRLAKFKVPKSVEIVETLPRTASGKVQKHVLRAQVG